ncbi:low molecular weight phosphatase family protein [Alloscardovia omnicolens]|uniref:arsenate-mycothiol transferase ArsC n=1 Tax=Alloscardovia omnicolens TaxID=419015 RepID=UPI003A63C4C7
MPDTPEITILFACRQNAGRSQIAAALAKHFIQQNNLHNVIILSAGSEPADNVHPQVVQVLAQLGLSPDSSPKQLLPEDVKRADYVITMGCSETCPFFPGVHYEDWKISDPHHKSSEEVREIAQEIKARVEDLFNRILAKS